MRASNARRSLRTRNDEFDVSPAATSSGTTEHLLGTGLSLLLIYLTYVGWKDVTKDDGVFLG